MTNMGRTRRADKMEVTPKKDIATTVAAPSTTLNPPKPLPKAGALNMATPRTMTPADRRSVAAVSN